MIDEAVILRCMRPDLKEMLLKEVDHPGLRALPKCGDGSAIGFAIVEGTVRLVKEIPEVKVGSRRAPSEYNLFIKQCLPVQRGPQSEKFRACAVKWRQRKKS